MTTENTSTATATGDATATATTATDAAAATTDSNNQSDATKSGGTDTGSATTTTDTSNNAPWYASFQDETVKAYVANKKWGDAEAQVKSHMALEQAFSGKMDALIPKTSTEYAFTKPGDLPEALPYDDNFALGFKNVAHKMKLTQEQAAGLHDWFYGTAKEGITASVAQQQTQLGTNIQNAENTLTKEWGAQDNEVFTRNMEFARRAAQQLGLTDKLKAWGVTTEVAGKTKVVDADTFKALAKIGSSLYQEDSQFGPSAPSNNANPFDPKTRDATAQGYLVQNDPVKARMLIEALPPAERTQYAFLLSRLKG